MKSLLKRNLKLYFKDTGAVFFSVLSVLIVIVLYVVFLGDSLLSDDAMQGMEGADLLMKSWVSAGILAVASFTTTTGAFGIMVTDKVRKTAKDFYASPLKRGAITQGYLLAAFLIGVIMTVLALVLAEVFLICSGGTLLPWDALLKTGGLILLTTFSNTAVVCFLVSFFKSNNAFSAASVILGTLVGFLTGVYMPIGGLAPGVQWCIKLFPASHSAVLFRQIFMEQGMNTAFAGAPEAARAAFAEELGIVYTFGSWEMTGLWHMVILALVGFLFYGLALWNMRRKKL